MPYRIAPPAKQKRRQFFRHWRKSRGLTLEQLAERLDTSASSLSRIEQGEQDFTGGFLAALADALQIDEASLLMRNPTDSEGLWSIWDQAKPAQRQQIVEIAKTITRTGT